MFGRSEAPPPTKNIHITLTAESLGVSEWCVCAVIEKCVLVPVSQCWDMIQQPLKKMDEWIEGGREGLLNLRGFMGSQTTEWHKKKSFSISELSMKSLRNIFRPLNRKRL